MSRVITPAIGRRAALAGLVSSGAALVLPRKVHAAGLPTPPQTEGPFYPVDWSGDADNDLVVVNGEAAQALGKITHVSGRILGSDGAPIGGAQVEIWQCDANGIYHHPRDMGVRRRPDAGFQGRGRMAADAQGRYTFRTIRPVPYPGRTPHIHFRIDPPGGRPLITQMYVAGEPGNERDGILNSLSRREQESVIIRLEPADGIEPGALAATFDVVLG